MGKHELEKINLGVIPITVYRGCLVTKLIGGYEIWGMKLPTPQEVDEAIEKASSIISESIPVDRGGVTVGTENGGNVALNSLEPQILNKTD